MRFSQLQPWPSVIRTSGTSHIQTYHARILLPDKSPNHKENNGSCVQMWHSTHIVRAVFIYDWLSLIFANSSRTHEILFSFQFALQICGSVFFISDSCIWHLFEMAVDKSKEFGRCIDTSCRAYYQNSEKQTQIRKVWNKIGINHKARTLNRQKWHSYNHKQGTKKSVVQRLFNFDLRWV